LIAKRATVGGDKTAINGSTRNFKKINSANYNCKGGGETQCDEKEEQVVKTRRK